MPLRKSVQKLECLSINQLDGIIRNTVTQSADYISEKYYENKISKGNIVSVELDLVIKDLQQLLLILTPHYLHNRIVDIIVTTLSRIHTDAGVRYDLDTEDVIYDIVSETVSTTAERTGGRPCCGDRWCPDGRLCSVLPLSPSWDLEQTLTWVWSPPSVTSSLM